MSTFLEWLQGQTTRDDIVGDFSTLVLQQDELPDQEKPRNEHQKWAGWLVDHKAPWDLVNAFNISWKEYQASTAE